MAIVVTIAAFAGMAERGQAQSGPSFDCADALTPTERTICGDRRLSQLDFEMSRAYSAALAANPAVRDVQKSWLKVRDSCGRIKGCLASQMQRRIGELQQISANGGAAPTPGERTTKDAGADELARLQEAMRLLGLYDGVVDGLDGPRTQAAISELLRRYTFARPRMSVSELADVARAEATRRFSVAPTGNTEPTFTGIERPLSEGFWSFHGASVSPAQQIFSFTKIGRYTFAQAPGGGVTLTRTDARKAVSAEFRPASGRDGLARVGTPPQARADIQFTRLAHHYSTDYVDVLTDGRGKFLVRLADEPELAALALDQVTLSELCRRTGGLAAGVEAEIFAAMANARVSRPADLDWKVRAHALRMGLFGPTSSFAEVFGQPITSMSSPVGSALFRRMMQCAIFAAQEPAAEEIGYAILRPYGPRPLNDTLDSTPIADFNGAPTIRLNRSFGSVRGEVEEAMNLSANLDERIASVRNGPEPAAERAKSARRLAIGLQARMVPSEARGAVARLRVIDSELQSRALTGTDTDGPLTQDRLIHVAVQEYVLNHCNTAFLAIMAADNGNDPLGAVLAGPARSERGVCITDNGVNRVEFWASGVSSDSCSGNDPKACIFQVRWGCRLVNNPDFTSGSGGRNLDPICPFVTALPVLVSGLFSAPSDTRWTALDVDW